MATWHWADEGEAQGRGNMCSSTHMRFVEQSADCSGHSQVCQRMRIYIRHEQDQDKIV